MSRPSRDREAQLKRMMADGPIGEVASMLCLTAALAVKYGEAFDAEKLQIDRPGHPDLPDGAVALMRRCAQESYESMKEARPEEVDAAIDMYTAHLRAIGYQVQHGRVH